MRISEVSQMFNISADTLRYYEKEGLIGPVQKTNSGVRDYSEEDIERIRFIICMRQAGLSIDVLYEFCQLYTKGNSTMASRLDILNREKEKLIHRIEEMNQTLDYLNYKINIYETKIEEMKK